MNFYASDILQAAKTDSAFDVVNAYEISSYHNVNYDEVIKEIIWVRKRLTQIID